MKHLQIKSTNGCTILTNFYPCVRIKKDRACIALLLGEVKKYKKFHDLRNVSALFPVYYDNGCQNRQN